MMNKLDTIIEHCHIWAEALQDDVETDGAYIFGSAIHRGGDQFDLARSDLDLVVLIPPRLAFAPARYDWLIKLQEHKSNLEISLLRLLNRTNAGNPIVSIVAASSAEVASDVHKSAVRDFFRTNKFRKLGAAREEEVGPLLCGSPREIDEQTRQVLGFVQGVRNKFLGVSPSGHLLLSPWDDTSDPMPKELMRYAAVARQVRPRTSDPGSSFDTQVGLDEMFHYLFDRRDNHPKYRQLYHWLSVRRMARGQREALAPEGYVFLAEVLYDIVAPEQVPDSKAASVIQDSVPASGKPSEFSQAIAVTFEISERQRLYGSLEEISASIDEASTNLVWHRTPPFTVRMTELEALDSELSPGDLTLPKERRRRAKATHRRNQLVLVKPLVERGLTDLLYYQHVLLPHQVFGTKQRKYLIVAMQVFIHRAFQPVLGGVFQAWKPMNGGRQLVVEFSLPPTPQTHWLESRPESKGLNHLEQMLELAANNPYVSELPLTFIAKFFIPEVLLTIIDRMDRGWLNLKSVEDWAYAYSLETWRFGPR